MIDERLYCRSILLLLRAVTATKKPTCKTFLSQGTFESLGILSVRNDSDLVNKITETHVLSRPARH
jgi:hypothetical protein